MKYQHDSLCYLISWWLIWLNIFKFIVRFHCFFFNRFHIRYHVSRYHRGKLKLPRCVAIVLISRCPRMAWQSRWRCLKPRFLCAFSISRKTPNQSSHLIIDDFKQHFLTCFLKYVFYLVRSSKPTILKVFTWAFWLLQVELDGFVVGRVGGVGA